MKIPFCFRGPNLAIDEDGNPSDAFILLKFDATDKKDKRLTKEEYDIIHNRIANEVIKGKKLIPISIEEYINNVDSDNEDYTALKSDFLKK